MAVGTLVVVAIACAAGRGEGGPLPVECVGDCDRSGVVAVDELVAAVTIVLGSRPPASCTAADPDSSGTVEVNELIMAVRSALDGCPAGANLFTIRACASAEMPEGQTFRVAIGDPAVIAEAESRIGAGPGRILSGMLRPGDGGFNAPWGWHLDPATVEFSDFAIELCDGCPEFIEDDLDYWIDVVGQYCPWSAEVVARER